MPKIKQLIDIREKYLDCLRMREQASLIPQFERALELHNLLVGHQVKFDALRHEIKTTSREFSKTKDPSLADRSRELRERTTNLNAEAREMGEELQRLELMLPNWYTDGIPVGKGDELAKSIKYIGEPSVWAEHKAEFITLYADCPKYRVMNHEPFHHYDLVGSLVDQETGGEIAESRFCFELDELVILDLALTMYAVEFFRNQIPFSRLMIPPFMMRRSIEEQTTYFEAFEDTIFEIERGEMILLPSSEHAIISYYADTIFDEEELPIRAMAWSPCFRREEGSHGKDTRGLFRVKQFMKIELHSIVKEGEDQSECDFLSRTVENFMESLQLPCRTVVVPTGDMDKRALKQLDIEAWMPGQGRYRETHSIATIGTWASEKQAMRYRSSGKKKTPVRNVYATAVAIQRMLCVIAENHYDPATNSIRIPEVLRKYTMGLTSIPVSSSQ